MSELLSGLIGAVIATILSVIYLYFAERWKLRTEIALEVAAHCDDIYDRLQRMYGHKDSVYTHSGSGMSADEYRTNSHELSRLLKATTTHAKLEITYGASQSVAALNELSHHFREIASLLMGSTETDWSQKSTHVFEIFHTRIDPLRKDLQRKLIDGTRVSAIANDLLVHLRRCSTPRAGGRER